MLNLLNTLTDKKYDKVLKTSPEKTVKNLGKTTK